MSIFTAIKESLEGHWGVIEWIAVSAVFFLLLIAVPVWTTPGNDFLFQLSILEPEVLALMIALSVLNGLLVVMQIYIRKHARVKKKGHQHAKESATAFGIIVSSLTATLACAACYSSVLALIGLGTASVIVQYRTYIAAVALILTLVAIYYSAKRINNHCAVCSIG